MDAFFAQVEKRDNPHLMDKPVIIGGHPENYSRGVVSTCCYIARKYGVKSAMSTTEAYRRCPEGIFITPNGKKYSNVSREIMAIFHQYTPLVEPVSIDEAFLDVSGCEKLFGPPLEIAKDIQKKVYDITNLTCSIGVAPNKFLAKLASDLKKPNGITVINSDEISEVLDPLAVNKIWGIGPKQKHKLSSLGINTIKDLKKLSLEQLKSLFGINGSQLYNLSRGVDYRKVQKADEVKSVSNEQTFMEDISDPNLIRKILLELSDKVSRRLRNQKIKGKTVSIKVRDHNFNTYSSQITVTNPVCLPSDIYKIAMDLFNKPEYEGRKIRLLGVGVSNLSSETCQYQIDLFEDEDLKEKEATLQKSIDNILDKYGDKVIYRASLKTKEYGRDN